ncbi:MAG: radical SAM protein [bacterium]
MLDILLINPNSSAKPEHVDLAAGVTPPLGICYVSAFLKQQGLKAKVLDANALQLANDQIMALIGKEKPMAIGLSAITPLIITTYRLVDEIKENFSQIKIILGGPHATALPEKTLAENKNVDVVVRGEGEITALNLLRALKAGASLAEVKGIAWRQAGRIIVNESQAAIADLDSLPEPDRADLPINKYVPSTKWFNRLPFMTVMTSRGCPNNCVFCSSIFGRSVRFRRPQNVLTEIKNLISDFGVREIIFYDDTFTLSKSRVYELCDLFIQNKLDITWGCLSRVDRVDGELLRKMKAAGCHLMAYGIESGSTEMLAVMRKNINLGQAEEAIRETKKAGIDCSASFVFGLPGETKETMQKTIDFSLKINPLFAQFFRVVPYPGTDLFDIYLRQKQSAAIDWGDFVGLGDAGNLIKLDQISEADFNYYLRKSYRRFYLRPRKIGQLFFKMLSPHKIKGLLIAGWLFVKFFLARKTEAV